MMELETMTFDELQHVVLEEEEIEEMPSNFDKVVIDGLEGMEAFCIGDDE